jgi:hypothetical protein
LKPPEDRFGFSSIAVFSGIVDLTQPSDLRKVIPRHLFFKNYPSIEHWLTPLHILKYFLFIVPAGRNSLRIFPFSMFAFFSKDVCYFLLPT